MKTFVRKYIPKFIIKKRVPLIASFFFTVSILFLAAGCIKEDYPVRLVFPVITTVAVTDSTTTGAISGGDITSDGGNAITTRGVCWSTKANPSIIYPDSITVDGTGPGIFTSTITGLVPNKSFHVRAYATNSEGTSYGQDISFRTPAN